MTVLALPRFGTLYLFNIPLLANSLPLSLPPGSNFTLLYKPDSNYVSARDGVDSFVVEPSTAVLTGCPTTIQFTILASSP